MNELREAYVKDPRIPCQYGRKCYQKNPLHHNKYKHPPDPKRKETFNQSQHKTKRTKVDVSRKDPDEKIVTDQPETSTTSLKNEDFTEKTNTDEVKFSNDVSDTESEEDSTNMQSSKTIETGNKKVETKCEISNQYFKNVEKELATQSTEANKTEDSYSELDRCEQNSTNSVQSSPHKNYESSENKCDFVLCNHKTSHNNEYAKKFIQESFLFDMPDDFYKFFEFCERLSKDNPCQALSTIGLRLVGPFDVLDGKFCGMKRKDDKDYLIHWRYFYDPPQMQTVLKGDDKSGYHIGYFRDFPTENPVFMVENYAMKGGTLESIGENIFAAVNCYIEGKKRTADPFSKLQINKIGILVKEEAEKLGYNLSTKTKNMIKRNNKVLSRTFNKIGLVVPYERNTQLGYRKLAMSDKALETLLTNIKNSHTSEEKQKLLATLQAEILTWTDIASDECDFGTGIELGWDIMCHGVDLNHTVARLLTSNFRQLKWEAFAKIAEAHMANRKKGCNLSIL